MSRTWYVVRVREKTGPDTWVKKSKFFLARGPGDAASKYRGSGMVMHATKVSKEKLLGVGGFCRLGDELLRELREAEATTLAVVDQQRGKARMRRYQDEKRKDFEDVQGGTV